MKHFPDDIFEKLEFDKVIGSIADECMGSDGKSSIKSPEFYTDKDVIELRLNEIQDFMSSIANGESLPFSNYENLEQEIYLLSKENYVLEIEAIQKIRRTAALAHDIYIYFKDFTRQKKYPNLYTICQSIYIDPQLSIEIAKVFHDNGELRPDASPTLLKISKAIIQKEREANKAFKIELQKYGKLGFLSESQESVRNGRRVITVGSEHKRKIGGIIHDESSTGKMSYIEPESIISLNNDIHNLHTEKRVEIYKILKDLCNTIRPFRHDLKLVSNQFVRIDVIRAKAKYAIKVEAAKPEIVSSAKLNLVDAKNPILYQKLLDQKEEIVHFDLVLLKNNRILILSGPNAGGKSVTMKTVGLLQLMLQSGIMPTADPRSKFGIFKSIFVDIGDQQSLEDDLSTYSSHLHNMKNILDHVDRHSLVLIDEFGSGTDPKIGGAIAEAILHEVNLKKAFGVITTHYSNLKYYAYKMKGLLNGSMEFDNKALKPTYQLIVGRPGSSFAFEIARKTGLPERALQNARKKAGKNQNAIENMLVDLQTERKELQDKMNLLLEKEERADKLIKTYDNLLKEIEFQRRKIKLERKEAHLQQTTKESKELQQLIKELKKEKNLKKAEVAIQNYKKEKSSLNNTINELKQEVFESSNIKDEDLTIGSFVRMRNSESVGKILSVKKDKVELEVGFLKFFVDKRDLLPAKEPITMKKSKSVNTSMVSGIGGKIERELDLRGYKVDDAMWFLEEFIERGLMNNVFELKIIHGIGNGIMKKHVHKKLRDYSEINKIWHPEEEFGGHGVTLFSF